MATAGLEVKEAGRALRVQAEAPHLVSMGSGRLSTAITLHPLPEGQIIIGSDQSADISITGTGVELIHCTIENHNGIVTLHPVSGDTLVDGVIMNSPIKLTQGCILSIGRSNYMRFNNPAEAKQLKSVLPNSRISMTPINFCLLSENLYEHLERKPPTGPRKSLRDSCLDDEIGFQSKLTKFEMLARQNRNCVSPKVFPAGSLTTNVPAVQILGHSRTTNLISLGKNENSPLRNLTNFDKSRSSTPNHSNSNNHINYIDEQQQRIDSKSSSRSNISNSEYCIPISNHNQIQLYTTTEAFLKHYKPQYNENNNGTQNLPPRSKSFKHENNYDLMSRSLTCQVSSEIDKFSRKFDMSQSLIVAKTTMTEYFQVDKFESNPNLCNRPTTHGSHSSVNNIKSNINFGSSPNIKRIQAPSPSFNRNPKYSDHKKLHENMITPKLSTSNNCSFQELQEREIDAEIKTEEAQKKIKIVQKERLREQEIEKQEKIRLEEILTLCAEYEKQNTLEKPKQPNRIKTNGSLPRDRRPGQNSPFNSSQNSPISQSYFSFDSSNQNSLLKSFQQNGSTSYNTQNGSPLPDKLISPNNNRQITWQNSLTQSESNLTTKTSQSQILQEINEFQNYKTDNYIDTGTSNSSPFSFENISIKENINHYENVINLSQRNNNPIYATVKKNGNLTNSCEIIDNKLAISNDDLLEAIEQLSMLSKSKEIYSKPKNNKIEKKNTKSNEVKADKEKKELEDEDKRKYIAFLQNEKLHILGNMDALKRGITDIETQEEEISRELELEKALLSAEYESESLKLTADETEKINIQIRINKLEREMAEDTSIQANLQAEAKCRVEKVHQLCIQLGNELKNCDDNKQKLLTDKLHVQQDALETEKKTFEDLEFHHLEEEASKLATREELQRYLSELSHKIEERKLQLNHLESQRNEAKTSAMKDSKTLERQKLGLMRRLEEGRNRLRAIDDELQNLTKNTRENSEEKRSPSREDFDRISKVTHNSPIVNSQGSLGRKTIESLKEIERNRQLHLAKQGSQVISEERRRVEELKRRVQDEVRSQWEERKMNCASFNSVESGEESSNYSNGPTESGSRSSDGADIGINEKMSPCKLSEFTSPSLGTSNNSFPLLKNENVKDGRTSSIEGERVSSGSIGITDGDRSRPLSQTSSEVESIGSLQIVKHRDKTKLQRPLTRYLPIKSESLDLRHHIETAGHQLSLINDVTIDTTTCSGYLLKMSKKFHHWNKRWFIFDRKRKTLSYYSDNSSKKTRGLIYFQSIEEVYVDHMNTVRSPQPSLTFIIKTSTRSYHLMAPSSEAMRVWVDVVFTGAEGYHEFDHQV
ncbi:pleckstrin homology-like domain family B member 2 [Microplitis demolitor]|uniref:pleckstrin homology-like domain family B member 2 n=1 Tax=Microplitis demolitor TaxID=69319 RepID=UPI0004CD9219|nr:pleckstrin homology-like domain family B member 2 [Microplitis demolitor]